MELFVITGTEVIDTGSVSFKFMAASKVPFRDIQPICNRFGTLMTRPYGPTEINPFSFVNGGPAQTAKERIDLHIFESGKGQLLAASMDYADGVEIESLFGEVSFVLLVERGLYERALLPMLLRQTERITSRVFHYDGRLTTS